MAASCRRKISIGRRSRSPSFMPLIASGASTSSTRTAAAFWMKTASRSMRIIRSRSGSRSRRAIRTRSRARSARRSSQQAARRSFTTSRAIPIRPATRRKATSFTSCRKRHTRTSTNTMRRRCMNFATGRDTEAAWIASLSEKGRTRNCTRRRNFVQNSPRPSSRSISASR